MLQKIFFKIELLSKYNMSISGCFFIQRIIDNLFDIVAVCKSKVLIYFFFQFPAALYFHRSRQSSLHLSILVIGSVSVGSLDTPPLLTLSIYILILPGTKEGSAPAGPLLQLCC